MNFFSSLYLSNTFYYIPVREKLFADGVAHSNLFPPLTPPPFFSLLLCGDSTGMRRVAFLTLIAHSKSLIGSFVSVLFCYLMKNAFSMVNA